MPRLFSLFLGLLALWPVMAAAQGTCDGRDLRQTLTAAEQADLNQALDGVPYTEGNYWIARRGDEVVHLVGTMHLADPRFGPIVERLTPVIEGASTLLLEATPDEEKQLEKALAERPELLLLADTTLPEIMEPEDWDRLAEAATARGIPPFMASKFQPWYLSVMLAVPPCAMAQLAEKNGLDARLIAVAREAGVPMRALEPYDTVFEVFTNAPLDVQIEMMKTGLSDPQASEDQFATLLAGYFDERHAAGWELTRVLSYRLSDMDRSEVDKAFDEIEAGLLVSRNAGWVPVILDAVGPEPVIVAVGAAHFHGEAGVLRLLEEAGFTLERQPF